MGRTNELDDGQGGPPMIITLTANPSLDRSVDVGTELVPGGVHRIISDVTQPGGKGINVALGVARAGLDVLAVLPAGPDDPLLSYLRADDLPFKAVPVSGPVRTNLTVLGDGETTKINEPGATLSAEEVAAVEEALAASVGAGDAVMLSGSLAPGFPEDEYARLIRALRPLGAWVGVDTSDAPLIALGKNLADAAPDFLKPNGLELGQLTGRDGIELERRAEHGDVAAVRDAAADLHEQGVGDVLVTLGGAGAVLAAEGGVWYSPSPPAKVISTVGAGDSATAGFLIARAKGLGPAERLAYAVAYGSAAVALPGTTIPMPSQVFPNKDVVTAI